MPVPWDISNDFQVWDDLEAVTYTSPRATGPLVDNIPNAMRRAPTLKEQAASGGVYTRQDLVWLVPANQIQVGPPKPGDVLTPAEQVDWTVLQVETDARGTVYRLTARALAIAFDLQDTIDIQRAGLSYDGAGATLKAWPDDAPPGGRLLYAGLACRVQPEEAAITDERGMRGLVTRYTVTVARQVPDVTDQDRVAWLRPQQPPTMPPMLTYLEIRGVKQLGLITELPQLECELVP